MFSDETKRLDLTIEVSWISGIQEYLLVKDAEGYTPNTSKVVKSVLGRFSNYCIDNKAFTPRKVTRRLLRQYLAYMREESYSPRYCNAVLSKIRGFYNFLVLEEYMEDSEDPTKRVKFMPVLKKVIIPFNDDEMREMIKVASSHKNQFFAERDKLIIMILADCGLRVNELVTLKDSNVSTESIFVHKAKKRRQRLLYVTPPVARQIIKYRRVRDAYFKNKNIDKVDIFLRGFRGEVLTNDAIQRLLKRIEKKCHIRKNIRVSPHTFRHWFAQQQLQNVVDIYDDLNHADDRVKDSIIVLDYKQVAAYELGGVTDWIQLDDYVIYVKNGMIKLANMLKGTVIHDKKEIVERCFSVFLKQKENEKNEK